MRIVPVFYLKSRGVEYATGATKVEYNRIWERTLGVLRERYPHFKFHATAGTESFSVQLHVGTVAASEAVTYYTVSKGYSPTVQVHVPVIADVKEIVEVFVEGIVGVLQEVYPEYFREEVLEGVLKQIASHPEQRHSDLLASDDGTVSVTFEDMETVQKRMSRLKMFDHRSDSRTSKLKTPIEWPRRMGGTPSGGGDETSD